MKAIFEPFLRDSQITLIFGGKGLKQHLFRQLYLLYLAEQMLFYIFTAKYKKIYYEYNRQKNRDKRTE